MLNNKINSVPKVAAIHDMSGYGRCSLTVILPIISALGSQVCPIPTAILSSHPLFKDFYFYDCTEHIEKYYHNWELNSLKFDCMYSGFLGSQTQIDMIIEIIEKMKANNNTLAVIDPVMGDHGKVYSTYNQEMVNKMSELIKHADIITPNFTEASILLKKEYTSKNLNIDTLKEYLKGLSDIGPKIVIMTGIHTNDNQYVNLCYDKTNNEYYSIPYEYVDAKFPGTGDLFTALFVGYILRGKSLPQAIEEASKFVTLAVKTTISDGTDPRNGVAFEKIIKELFNEINDNEYKYRLI
jgi:pyridoxine kinase